MALRKHFMVQPTIKTDKWAGIADREAQMTDTFRALVIDKDGDKQSVALRELTESDLMPGEVTIKVAYSTINYKDGLAITGAAPVVRTMPMVGGIDLAGVVVKSDDPAFKEGDEVIANGWGLGETHWGGYGELARLKSHMVTPLPKGLSLKDTMAVGTAGYTAGLCVLALLDQGVATDNGPILVTGAAGGVGSFSLALLASKGYEAAALTGRTSEEAYLKQIGATEIIDREEMTGKPKPLGKERFAGVVDSVGSSVLANAISMVKYGGTVAACGLAAGMDLPTSVAPFILRGIKLVGIESVYAPQDVRKRAWDLISENVDASKLSAIAEEIALEDVPAHGQQILEGKVRGRLIVKVGT